MKEKEIVHTGCCDPFNPEPFQDKTIVWEKKLFLKDKIKSFFHIPLNFDAVMVKNASLIEKSGAKPDYQLILVDENSLWGADIYISVGKSVENAKMEEVSGTFLTRVYEGPYSKMSAWIKDFNDYCDKKDIKPQKLYFSYTTCPKCAKIYGKNYVVFFGRIK